MTRLISLAAAALSLTTAAASAQELDGRFSVNLFPTVRAEEPCAAFEDADLTDCTDLASSGIASGPGDVYVVVARAGGFPRGIRSLSVGIQHDLVGSVDAWDLCNRGTSIAEPAWPASDTGIEIAWPDDCYFPSGEVARVGLFTVSPIGPSVAVSGLFRVGADPRLGDAEWEDCAGNRFSVCLGNLAVVEVSRPADALCATDCLTPVGETTWARIRSTYR